MADSWTSSSVDAHLDWTPGSGRTQLAHAIRAAIRDGRWRPGSVVPSTRALAADLGVARGTVTRVYADLAAEGYLRTSQGAPTRVATAGAAPLSSPDPAYTPGTTRRWTLLAGRPDVSLFPRDQWLTSTRRVLTNAPHEIFGYGEQRGSLVLRTMLAAYLGRSRGVLADPARIVVVAGFTHAITVLGRAFADLGMTETAFEDPSIDRFRHFAAVAGQKVVGVPVDDEGLVVDRLSSPAVVVTPAHQAPLGVTMAPGRRTALARSGAVIVEDDYDGEFRFDRQQVGALQALAPERVVYAGTASKTLAPSLRLGWLVLPRFLVDPVIAALESTGVQPPMLDQLALADLISSGAFDRHVRRCRLEYRARRDRLAAALPAHLTPRGIPAGLALFVPLSAAAEAAVPASAARHSLTIEPVSPHAIRTTDPSTGLMIGYAASSKASFGGALAALRGVLRDVSP
ncbi:aminotransferase-like domain-containing protein [Actinophytocola algeriensis]|uniref:GntR family transcriptional regulator/MocR family aminotransferase n=1 Tax=Actinophytocola algeriensis TaxID=1768010 RepID=A0A7W7Q9X1_9PSEU|nr:PLP-dependent aminotransferase family protein [Actinophytocola algeriensis]MBB4909715.1 GntR family transcriptional regulator/MocR family aminotransferase [Actinophytocola algeriensis]MBE1475705.1 GntR family transcriptional regulator/MocR family aminotransferase [Actinophytocola algeriensis]